MQTGRHTNIYSDRETETDRPKYTVIERQRQTARSKYAVTERLTITQRKRCKANRHGVTLHKHLRHQRREEGEKPRMMHAYRTARPVKTQTTHFHNCDPNQEPRCLQLDRG